MSQKIATLVLVLGFAFTLGAHANDRPAVASSSVVGNLLTTPYPTFMMDAETPPVDCDVDADADVCGKPAVCSCKCGGVLVHVTIYPDRYGETCGSVNGRPCNTGAGPFVYTGC